MKDTILVVTSYPEKGTIHGEGTVGIASYTKNTLLHVLKTNPLHSFSIMAEVLSEKEIYEEDGMNIQRIWKRNSLTSLFRLFQEMMKPYQQIIIPFEVYMFGNAFFAGIFLSFLAFMKLLGKKITIIVHQVPEGIDDVETHTLRARLFPFLKHVLYNLITFSARTVVIFEETFKKRLGNKKNIVVIPHAVEPVNQLPQIEAKKKLDIPDKTPLVLYFGFLSPYKGVDQLIEAWEQTSPYILILAGGGNPNHMTNPEYQKYIQGLHSEAEKKDIQITGFVLEEDLNVYFSAADIIILPYRTFFSSSGPLSLAFAYEKPVLLSPALSEYFSSEDFAQTLKENALQKNELISKIEKEPLAKHLEQVLRNYNRYQTFSRELKQKRSWNTIGKKYADLLTEQA
ncbi:glycosyltransferase [Candidatus Roizmanbacteria bacterium]|nr:MAG: glycosyltransferase [Candidatus Roizmanbacteria bacterium]